MIKKIKGNNSILLAFKYKNIATVYRMQNKHI